MNSYIKNIVVLVSVFTINLSKQILFFGQHNILVNKNITLQYNNAYLSNKLNVTTINLISIKNINFPCIVEYSEI